MRSLDARKRVVLILLSLSAALDTIDHDLLLAEFGCEATHFAGPRPTSPPEHCVSVDGHLSCNIQLRHGVPRIRSFLPLREYTRLSRRDSTSETPICTALQEPCCIDSRWSSDQLRVSSSAYVDVTNTAWRRHYERCTGHLWRSEFSLNC